MGTPHHYELGVRWTGNRGEGTASVRSFGRDHEVSADGLPTLLGSADPAFRGDPARWNPEQFLLASLAQCHLLTYLWLAAQAGVVVTAYDDHPTGTMVAEADGSGRFREVTLRPHVTITADGDVELARRLHDRVGDYCFIARSINFTLHHEPTVVARPVLSRHQGNPTKGTQGR
jgi:organic hydroperoxide reductase OsmC/OhrA